MNRRGWTLTASALVMALLGGVATFAPQELSQWAGATPKGAVPLIIQLAGALYLGFAMANWMARGSLIGGIYARPLALGNFLHFTVGALALLRQTPQGERSVLLLAGVYASFAVAFGMILFTNPVGRSGTDARP